MHSACTPMLRASGGFQVVALVSALSVISTGGCASSYQPAPGPRIATVMADGELTLVRDGESFPAGFFGGGVVKAVESNSAALEHAHSYRRYTIAGWSVYFGGLGLGLTGIGLWQAGKRNDDVAQQNTGDVLMLAGLAALITGAGLLLGAQPHLWDAINLYNDEVDRRLRSSHWPTPSVPPYAVPPILTQPTLAPPTLTPPTLTPRTLTPPTLTPPSGPQPSPASPGPTSPSPASPGPAPAPAPAPAPSGIVDR